jgi:hypothetical protein
MNQRLMIGNHARNSRTMSLMVISEYLKGHCVVAAKVSDSIGRRSLRSTESGRRVRGATAGQHRCERA